jgi:hypothetical protein
MSDPLDYWRKLVCDFGGWMFYYKRGYPIVAFGTKFFTSFWDLETYFTLF